MLVALMFTVFGGSSGNEMLDYVDADTYFKSKGIEMTVESLILEAKSPDVGLDAFAKEASVRRLIVLRTLGDLKDKKAIAVIESFLDSKVMFVAHCAQRALAKIEGKPMPMITAYESLQFKTQAKEGIITLEIPHVESLELIFGIFLATGQRLEHKAVEIKPTPYPAPAKP